MWSELHHLHTHKYIYQVIKNHGRRVTVYHFNSALIFKFRNLWLISTMHLIFINKLTQWRIEGIFKEVMWHGCGCLIYAVHHADLLCLLCASSSDLVTSPTSSSSFFRLSFKGTPQSPSNSIHVYLPLFTFYYLNISIYIYFMSFLWFLFFFPHAVHIRPPLVYHKGGDWLNIRKCHSTH